MEVKPIYCSFEQAKLLKEKGFGIPYKQMGYTTKFYNGKTKTLLSLGRTGKSKNLIPAPEQWQVIEWLRLYHGIWIEIEYMDNVLNFGYVITRINNNTEEKELYNFNSPQEAYASAIDYVLNNLI